MLSSVRKRYRTGLRLALGTAVAAAAVTAFTVPAQADPAANPGTVHGTFTDEPVKGFPIPLTGENHAVNPALFTLSVDGGGDLSAYCIDLHTSTRTGNKYREADWSAKNVGSDLTKINWILHNSFPSVQPDAIGKGAGVTGLPSAGLTKEEAVTATQAAIWHYSDHVDLKMESHSDSSKARWDRIYNLYKMLTNDKINTGIESEPAPTIALGDGHNLAGHPDEPIGPIAVHTSAGKVELKLADAPAGTKLMVKHGSSTTESTTAVNGDDLFVKVPAGADPGSTSVSATVSGQVATGRVFVGDPADSIQKLILAGSGSVSASASAEVTWSTKELPAFTASSENVCVPAGDKGSSGIKVKVDNSGKTAGDVKVTSGDFSQSLSIEAGASQSVQVPVKEGAKYTIEVTSGDFHQEFNGTLQCAVASSPAAPSPSASGQAGGGLPVTGTSLPIIVGSGLVLLVAGGVLLFMLRRRRNLTAGA